MWDHMRSETIEVLTGLIENVNVFVVVILIVIVVKQSNDDISFMSIVFLRPLFFVIPFVLVLVILILIVILPSCEKTEPENNQN